MELVPASLVILAADADRAVSRESLPYDVVERGAGDVADGLEGLGEHVDFDCGFTLPCCAHALFVGNGVVGYLDEIKFRHGDGIRRGGVGKIGVEVIVERGRYKGSWRWSWCCRRECIVEAAACGSC